MIEHENDPELRLLDNEASFRSFIQAEFNLPDCPNGHARLVEDLGFDSLLLLELVIVIHDVFGPSGTNEPDAPREYPILTTVNDALAYAADVASAFGEVLGAGVKEEA